LNFLLEIKEGLMIAWDSIRANKMRSILTTLGIVIGIVTVTLMGTAIEGLNRAFHNSISAIGSDTLYVNRFTWIEHSYEERLKERKRHEITLDQVKEVQKGLTLAAAVSPTVNINQSVRYKNRSASMVSVVGTTEENIVTSSLSISDGRFISAEDSDGGRPVCVIGADVATNLFLNETPLGKKIRIGPRVLEVVGVLERRGRFLGLISMDNNVIIPVQELLNGYWRHPDFQIEVKVRNQDQLEDAKEELRGVMRRVRRLAPGDPDDFAINQQDQFITLFNSVAGTIATAGLAITGLSLFVGGIGIMNIMFVSVAERTREIGVRKAIGAKRRAILLQFLIEAATICMLGGVMALLIAYLLTFPLASVLPVRMPLHLVGMALLVSAATGVIAGLLPAWRAARMNPVDALRNE
jgi:putative ABC transport system permease protein